MFENKFFNILSNGVKDNYKKETAFKAARQKNVKGSLGVEGAEKKKETKRQLGSKTVTKKKGCQGSLRVKGSHKNQKSAKGSFGAQDSSKK